jgi:hypothetical protein
LERTFKPDQRDIIFRARFLDLAGTSQARFLNLLSAISWFTIRDGPSKGPPPLAVFLISELEPGFWEHLRLCHGLSLAQEHAS